MRILVAVDGSETSRRAGLLAIDLAARTGSEISFMNVIPSTAIRTLVHALPFATAQEFKGPLYATPHTLKEKLTRRVLEVLEELRVEAEKRGLRPEFIIAEGDPARKIVEESRKGYDLLVIGYRGAWVSSLPGKVAMRVLERSRIPVLVVK